MPAFPIYIYFLAASFLVSNVVFFTRRYPEFYLRLFPFFLLSTLAVEVMGNIMESSGQTNIHIYNYFTTFEFCFYLFVLAQMIESKKAKRLIYWTIPLYVVASVINIEFVIQPRRFHTITYALGCLLLVIGSIAYFLELFRRPKSVKLVSTPAFWICSGLLFFYCSSFPLFGLANFWADISPAIIRNFAAIISLLNVFLYTLFSIAFLCRMKSRKYIS